MNFDLGGTRYVFADLKDLLAKASPARAGDRLAGVAAASAQERVAARYALADLQLDRFLNEALIPYERDEVTRLIFDHHDPVGFQNVGHMTVGAFRDYLLSEQVGPQEITRIQSALTPEMVAAVSKLMRNQDLIAVAQKCHKVTSFRTQIGLPGRLAVRLQPNHPTDDLRGIAASTIEGLLFGCGDAVIGINPATDNVQRMIDLLDLLEDLRLKLEVPTQSCVLAHVTTALQAGEKGAKLDIIFQSVAGSEMANKGFGIDLSILKEAADLGKSLNRGTIGQNCLYFETGQGSALSANAHFGVDQQTMECRAYGVARHFSPFLVNSVVGFIGPEYLFDGKEITRAGLEDLMCGKLLGLPMGMDVCYTNHADADQNDMDNLLVLLGVAGIAFVMGVPGADDIMLQYQSTSFHDVAATRQILGLRPAPEFEDWLLKVGLCDENGQLRPPSPHLSQQLLRWSPQ